MIYYLFALFLPLGVMSGWFFNSSRQKRTLSKHIATLRHDYFLGLNYLINDQTDKAVDVFIKMLEVDSETVEMHLALANLFRRRGEVDRAIRIHQNLIARPQLSKEQHTQALFELAKDYKHAGVLDRAERLFSEVIQANANNALSLKHLLEIYQLQKDWEQAIQVAKKIEITTGESMKEAIAHHYCELAEHYFNLDQHDIANTYLKKALHSDPACVRASLIQGHSFLAQGEYKLALKSFWRVKDQEVDYLSEALVPLSECYEKLDQEREFIGYLKKVLDEHPRISVVLMLAKYIRKQTGDKAAIDFIAEKIEISSSLRGLQHLIDLYLANSQGDTKAKLMMLRDLVDKLLTDKPIYRCHHCGFSGNMLHWLCPGCNWWGSVRPIHGVEGD